MNIIKQSAVYIGPMDADGKALTPYQIIEICGRKCYKSEDKITDGTAIKFCKAMLKNKHHAMLEHGRIYTRVPIGTAIAITLWMDSVKTNPVSDNITPYIDVTVFHDFAFISMSFRAMLMSIEYLAKNTDAKTDSGVYDYFEALINTYSELFNEETISTDLITAVNSRSTKDGVSRVKVFSSTAEFVKSVKNLVYNRDTADLVLKKHVAHTVIFTTNRGVTHELVRHRPASFAQESTRYCNYSQGKFNHEITVIEPCYYQDKPELMTLWEKNTEAEEKIYFEMINAGAIPQEARGNLLHDVKADIAITATENEWQHIINLRYHGTTGAPHPQAKEAVGCALPDLKLASNGRLQ